jgi:hypothetical protein
MNKGTMKNASTQDTGFTKTRAKSPEIIEKTLRMTIPKVLSFGTRG